MENPNIKSRKKVAQVPKLDKNKSSMSRKSSFEEMYDEFSKTATEEPINQEIKTKTKYNLNASLEKIERD